MLKPGYGPASSPRDFQRVPISEEGAESNSEQEDHELHLVAEDFLAKCGEAPWERATIDEEARMDINGETEAQMDHVNTEKSRGVDSTVDQTWAIDNDLAGADRFVMIMSAIWIIPKSLVFGLPLFLTLLPWYILAKVYQCRMDIPTDEVRRDSCGFIICIECLGRLFLFIPRILMALCLFLDFFFYYLFSVPYCMLCSRHRWTGYKRSQKAIEHYRTGPGMRWSDIMVCTLGQVHRNGFLECAKCFTGTVLLLPWIKYFINANPFVYELEERFVQQISTSLDDLALHDVHDVSRRIISRSIQDDDLIHHEHLWSFIPHYPYPPPDRRWAMGMQHVGKYFQLLTHVTHAVAEVGGSTEQFILSNSVAMPVYRVMLWYNNPYHFFTGFVEASLSNGLPSQADKKHGGEHPMWLVSSHSPLLSGRESMTGVGMIDAFFDFWLPTFVDGVREQVVDQAYADANHEEVTSKDGVSRPTGKKGLPSKQK